MKIYDLIALFSKEFKKDKAIFISISNSILSSKTETEKDAAIQTYIQNIHRICDASASLGLNGIYLFLQKLNQTLYELKNLDIQSQSMVEDFYKSWPPLIISYLDFIVDNAPDLKGSPNAQELEKKSKALMDYLSEPPACIELDSGEYEFIYSCLVEALQIDDKIKELISSISSEENSTLSFDRLSLALNPDTISLKLLPDYLKESLINIDDIYTCLDSLLSYGPDSMPVKSNALEVINSMKRAAHTIKGSSQMTGIAPISTLMHKLEDSLDNIASMLPVSTIMSSPSSYAQISLPLVDFVSSFLEFLQDYSLDESFYTGPQGTLLLKNMQTLGTAALEHFLDSLVELHASPTNLPLPRASVPTIKLDNSPARNLTQPSPTQSALLPVLSTLSGVSNSAINEINKNDELFAITKFCQENLDKLKFLVSSRSKNEHFNVDKEIKRLIDEISKKQVSAAHLCLEAKMVSVESIHQRLNRIVRTSSVACSKAINFTFTSNSSFIESNILKNALDAFMHIIRNCIDHGIESTNLRLSAGKTLEGNISFSASYLNNGVLFKISDDGYGLDLLKILNKAHKLNLIDDEKYALISRNINDRAHSDFLSNLIFKENFSTKETLSALSGRGVGLDIVKTIISNLGGTIEVKSKPGVYCDFLIWLPSSISLVQSVIFESSSQLFAVPSSSVQTLLDASSFKVNISSNAAYIEPIDFPGQKIAARYFNTLLQPTDPNASAAFSPPKRSQQAIVFKDKALGSLLVDKIITVQSLILEKPKCLGPARSYVSNISTINNGSIVSLINYTLLLDFLNEKNIPQPDLLTVVPRVSKKIFVIDDSPLMRSALNEFLSAQGFEVALFENGELALSYLNKTLNSSPPNIIITDLEMPGLSGFETIDAIKNIFKSLANKSLPAFIILSSKATIENIEKSKIIGCLDFVAKPYNEAQLLSLLQSQ